MLNSSSGSEDVDSQDCVVEGNKMSAWLWLILLQWLLASMVFLLFILVWPALIPTISCFLIFGNKQCQSPERHLIPPPDLVLSGPLFLFVQLFFLLLPPLASLYYTSGCCWTVHTGGTSLNPRKTMPVFPWKWVVTATVSSLAKQATNSLSKKRCVYSFDFLTRASLIACCIPYR